MSYYIGIDPSSRHVGLAALHEHGTLTHQALHATGDLPDRLVWLRQEIRRWLTPIADQGVMCAIVENPGIVSRQRGYEAKLAGYGVCLEAARSMLACPVLDLRSGEWKSHVLASGAAKKDDVMAGARLLGYTGGSQDVADAVCIADAARVLAEKNMRRAA